MSSPVLTDIPDQISTWIAQKLETNLLKNPKSDPSFTIPYFWANQKLLLSFMINLVPLFIQMVCLDLVVDWLYLLPRFTIVVCFLFMLMVLFVMMRSSSLSSDLSLLSGHAG